MSSPLVFLDIDGVLLPFGDSAPAPPAAPALFPDGTLQALSHVMAESGASLVLSSTWRARPEYVADIVQDFHRYACVHGGPLGAVDGFPLTTSVQSFAVRQKEIHQWLIEVGYQGPWVALDDEPLLEGKECTRLRRHFEGHVVQTVSHEGLTMAQATSAVELLRHQQDVYNIPHGNEVV